MVSGIIPCSQECKRIVYFGETPKRKEFFECNSRFQEKQK